MGSSSRARARASCRSLPSAVQEAGHSPSKSYAEPLVCPDVEVRVPLQAKSNMVKIQQTKSAAAPLNKLKVCQACRAMQAKLEALEAEGVDCSQRTSFTTCDLILQREKDDDGVWLISAYGYGSLVSARCVGTMARSLTRDLQLL